MHNADLSVAGQILAVGATDSSDQLADWGTSCSNRASWVDVYAPGRGIYTTNQGGGYDHVHGTSVATPIVSGAAALLWSLHPGWSANEVHDKILGRSAVLSAPGVLNGQKRLDVYATLGVPTLALSNASPTIQSDCSDGNAFTVAGGSDPDLSNPIIAWDSTDTLSYAFDDGSGNASLTSGPFEIDAVNGQISARAAACPLDPLASPHNLIVRVGDSLGMTATAPVTVSVLQVVSNVPNFGGVIDFETPAMGPMEERRGLDPFAAGAGALSFVVHDEFGFPDAVVGLVRNRATSACFEPSSANQTLGTGRDMSGTTDHIGLSGFPIRAIFSPPLQPNSGEQVRIGAQFQSGTGVAVRIRLFDAADNQVGTAQSTLSLTEGTCGYPGPQRAHATITATANTPVAYAVFDVPTNVPSGGRVFTIDSVDISVAP